MLNRRSEYSPLASMATVLCLPLMCAGIVRAQCPRYDVQVATACNPGTLQITSRNEKSTSVGQYGCVFFSSRPFIWYGVGSIVPIQLPASRPDGYAASINANHVIVGSMHNAKTGATYHAFLYDNEVVTDLGTLPGHNESQAVAINNLDPPTVVGYSHNNVTGPKRAVQWSEGVAIDLEVPIGPRNEASGVNDKNQIVGWMGVSWPSIASASLPFLWSDGTTIQLPLPLSAINGAADSINNIGDVIGNYRRSNPIGSGTVTRGLMWQHGKIVEFTPFSGFAHSTTSGVNDRTQVVGHFSNGGSDFTAFLWQNNSIYTLESLIPAHSTFTGVTVHSINNNSEIVGTATLIGSGTTVGVVLLPIPPVIGDVDCDQKVNVPDLLTVIHSWGACAPPAFGINCPADLDSDSNVGLNDLLTVVLNWAP